MKNSLQIRLATWDDLPTMLELQATSMRALAASYYDAEAIEAFIAFGTMDKDLVNEGSYFVVEQGAKTIATGGWSSRTPRYQAQIAEPSTETKALSIATVRSLFVHPNATRQGIASRLMQHIEEAMISAGYSEGYLTATLSGVALYRRLEWQSQGSITITLPGGFKLTGLHMRKPLRSTARIAA